MSTDTAFNRDPTPALKALFEFGVHLFQLDDPPVDEGTVIDPYLTEFGGVDTLSDQLQILGLTTEDDIAEQMRGRLGEANRRVVRSRFVNYPDLEADLFVSCPPSGQIEAPNIDYTVAKFGEWGSSSRAPLAPAVVESAFKGAREMAMFVLPTAVTYDDAYKRLTSLGRAHIRPAFEINDSEAGFTLVGFYIHDKDCPPPVFGDISDREKVLDKWSDKGWPGAVERAWKSIRDRKDQLTVPDLSEATQTPNTIRVDEPYDPANDRVRIALDGGGGQIRFLWERPVAHLKLQKALKICGWLRDNKSKQEVPLLDLESRARRVVRNPETLERLVGALESVGLRVEVDEMVYDWLDNERTRLDRQEVPFEQTIWDESSEEWITLHEDRGLTSQYPDLYNHYMERIEDEIPWPLWDFQKKDLARLLMKDNAMYAAFMGAGKAEPLDANILTPSGWVEMGDVEVGDQVIGQDGKATEVLGVYPQGEKEVYEVTFSDGATVECCKEHLWNVQSPQLKRQTGNFTTKTLGEIMEDGVRDSAGNRDKFIPMVEPVEFEPKGELPVDPYLLGVLLGDGYLRHTPVLSTGDGWVVEEVNSILPEWMETVEKSPDDDGCYDHRIIVSENKGGSQRVVAHKHPITAALRKWGLEGCRSHEKFVPEPYLYSSVEDRLSLLQGLMDIDGCVDEIRGAFTSTSQDLAEAVVHLARSLGGTASINSRVTKYDGGAKEGRRSWRVHIKLPTDMNPFRLPRKRDDLGRSSHSEPTRSIESIERVGSKECQCIKVDADDQLYVTDGFVVTHNTRILLSYIWLRQGDRNLVVLESKLIDELLHEAEKIGFPVEKINVIDEHEKAKPEHLKWLNVATYTRIWRSVDGQYRTREVEGWRVEVDYDGETRERTFEDEDDIPVHYFEDDHATVRQDTIEVEGPPCKSQAHVLRQTRFNALFFDEAHNLKGGKTTKQARYAQLLRAKHTVLMSGTIVKSYPRNIYALLVQAFGEQTPENYWAYDVPVLHPDGDHCTTGTRVFREDFVQVEYFSPKFDNTLEDGQKGREIPMVPEENLPEWRSMLAPKVLRRHRREPEVEKAIKIPDADFEVVEVDIDDNHAEFYGWWFHRFRDWFREQLAKERRDGDNMNAAQILAQLNKLQFASTVPQSDKVQAEGHCEWEEGLTRKQNRLIEEMERIEEEDKKAIIFSERPGLLDQLHEHLERIGIGSVVFHGDVGISRRIDRKNRFRNDEACTVLLMSRECGNTGYNLPEADEVWSADWSWTPDKMTQAEKRMLRSDWATEERKEKGQKPVIRRLVQKGTIDEYMRQLVETKSEGISEAIDYQESDFDPTEWMSFRDFSIQMFEDKGIDLDSL